MTLAATEVRHTACPLDCPDACSLDVTVEAAASPRRRRRRPQSTHRRLHLRQGPPLPEHVYGATA
jgi:hypothetical protein